MLAPSVAGTRASRGQGRRCYGRLDQSGDYARCTREEHAGALEQNGDGTFSHRLRGACRCGVAHGADDREPEVRQVVRGFDGTPLAVHVRRGSGDGKVVWWELPDGSKGLGGQRSADLLYGVERLADADADDLAFLLEGEPAADAVDSLGLVAVATVCGAKGCLSPSAAAAFAGRRVVLWPDADEDGRRHMERNAEALSAAGAGPLMMIHWVRRHPRETRQTSVAGAHERLH